MSVVRRARLRILLAPVLSLLVVGSVLTGAPANAQKIRSSFWGMHDNNWAAQPSPTVPVGSANLTTSGTYWRAIETRKGHYDWTLLNQQVKAAEAKHAQPMIVLGQVPKFHSSRPGSVDYDDYMPDMKAWKQYVGKVATKYGARLDYQIWPEPNIIQNWKGTTAQMAKLTAVAAQVIRAKAGRKPRIVSPAVALRLKQQQNWTLDYFKQKVDGKRVASYLNAIAIDPFPLEDGKPEDAYKIMTSIRKKLAGIGVKTPIWNNEINYGVAGAGDPSTTDYPMDLQQSYVIRTFALSAAARVQRTYWLGWFNAQTLAISMVDKAGDPLETATSYVRVRSWLNGTSFVGCSQNSSGVWVCTAKKGTTEVRRIYWKPTGTAVIRTPQSTLRVEDQEGGVNTRRGARNITLTYRPIMVASKK